MIKPVLHIVFVLTSLLSFAQQNLVPNFSFEQYSNCPSTEDQIQYATGWFKSSSNSTPTNTTPDYYNVCSSDTLWGVPKSVANFQDDHRNCTAYAGLVTFNIGYPNFREHIGIQLSSPMVIGQKYFLSFYAVMGGDIMSGGYYYTMPSNKIGMRLSTVAFNESNPVPIDNFAHLYIQSVFSDTANWTRFSGSIIADSAYQYLMMGNFFDDSHTDTVHLDCQQCQNLFGYFLIDDVCITTDSSFANGGMDTLPCILEINELNPLDELSVVPNPTSGLCTITSNQEEIKEVYIYDFLGKTILSKKVSSNTLNVDLSKYPDGIYVIRIIIKNKAPVTRKIIKSLN